MQQYLDLTTVPTYMFAGFRKFSPYERHINRVSSENVLLLILNGTLTFKEDGKEVTLNKGEYYIQKSGGLQEGHKASLEPYYFFIHFTGTVNANPDGIPIRGTFSTGEFMPLINSLNQSIIDAKGNNFKKTFLFMQIINNLIPVKHSTSDKLVDLMKEIMEKNYSQDFLIENLANQLNYSKDYIIKKFKKTAGITPHQYLTRLRISKAKNLLISSEKTLEEICSECGFTDISTFHRNFAKESGTTPHKFRSKNL